MNLKVWFRQDPLGAILALLVVGGGIASSPQALRGWQDNQKLRDTSRQASLAALSIQVKDEAQAELKKLAEKRYKRGVRFVISMAKPGEFAALKEGQPVIDASTITARNPKGEAFSQGLDVADVYGCTGKISPDKVVADLACTGNKAVVDEALQSSGLKALVRGPNQ